MEELRGETVLVAGGAGFVGSQLVLELLDLGARVVVYDNLLHGSRENLADVADRVTLIIGDVLDEWKLTDAFRTHRPSYVFNLVGDTYVPEAYDVPKRFFRINIEGNLNILMACKVFDVKRVLYVSSTEVYGEAQSTPMDESHAYDPLNTYAVSKLAADRLCFTFFHEHKIPVIIARIYNAYGPRETEPYVIPEIIAQLHRSNVVQLGNINARRDFTYVSDTARGLIAALGSNIPNGEAVNVGSNVAYSVKELAEAIGQIMGHDSIEIQIDERRLRHLDIELFVCNPAKLQNATGWVAQVGLQEGLEKTVDWFRSHGCRWVWESRLDGALTPK